MSGKIGEERLKQARAEYERFKLTWMLDHGFTIADLVCELGKLCQESGSSLDMGAVFADWEFEYGFGSQIWPCFSEFLECEYREMVTGRNPVSSRRETAESAVGKNPTREKSVMGQLELSSIEAISASAKLASERAGQEPDQDSYNAAWLHGYADALANVADALEPQRELMDAIIGYMGEQHDGAELYSILHNTLAMSDRDILSLGFDLPQCKEPSQADQYKKSVKKKGIHHER